MTTTSAIGNAIAALVAAVNAAVAAGSFGKDVAVFEGFYIADSELTLQSRIWIGYDPINPANPAAEGTQEFAALNQARSRNETFSIVCAVESWTGNADNATATVRANVFALLAQFELLLRGTAASAGPGDTTLGGKVLWSQVTGPIIFDYVGDDSGVLGQLSFHVACAARLTTS